MIINPEEGKDFDWNILKDVEVQENVLLAGAGFTRDFGGFLAEEMWTLIYNHSAVRARPKISGRMREDFNYESIYHEILTGTGYDEPDREAIQAAVSAAYMTLDHETKIYRPDIRPASLNGVRGMLNLLEGRLGKTGFFFTLNQDLFVERHCTVALPWVRPSGPTGEWDFDRTKHSVPLPDGQDLESLKTKDPLRKGGLYYVKLHGSMNWTNRENKEIMVIGLGKDEQIAREPLLRLYNELFAMVLTKAKRLLVIGYRFRDEHVNKAIAIAMAECNNPRLELYVISPDPPSRFIRNMTSTYAGGSFVIPFGSFMEQKLGGYFPCTLAKVFPSQGDDTMMWRMIRESLFR